MKKHLMRKWVKSVLNGRKPAFRIILVAFLAGVAAAACFLTTLKKPFDPTGTWELTSIVKDDEELSAGYLVREGVGFETFTLNGDGTGSWVTESINPGKSVHTMAFTYTRSGNVLTFVNLDQSSTFEVTYDPQKGTLSNEASYMTYIYSRVGETAAPDPTPDQLSGVWKTDGTNFGEDQILFGSLVLDRDGRAMLDLSTGGGSALQKGYTFFLDKQYLCLSTDEGSVYGLYDPKIDTIFIPFKGARSLRFIRADSLNAAVPAAAAPAAQSLPGIWELAWMESTKTDEAREEEQEEGPGSGEPFVASFSEEYELFYSGEKSYTMILYENGSGDLLIQSGSSIAYVTVGCDTDRQMIRQRAMELYLHYHFDGDQLILDGDGFRVGFKRFDFIPPSIASEWYDPDDPVEETAGSEENEDLSKEQADAFLNGLSVEFEDGVPYGCDLVCYIDGFGTCLNIGDPDAYKSASLRFEPTEERVEPIYPHFTYAEILSAGNREYYLRNIRVFKTESGDSMQKHETWDMDRPDADASIFVPIDPSLMERNRACPERVCVIKGFDLEKSEVTVSFAALEEPEEGLPASVNYDAVQEETHTFRVTDDTMLTLIDAYDALVRKDRFFRYLEEFGWYLDRADGDYRGIGFWIGCDGDTLLYLCEVFEE